MVLESAPETLRWVAATSMVLGIKRALRAAGSLKCVYLSAWSPDKRFQDEDVQMLRSLVRENITAIDVADQGLD
jgi:hypothetical protein